VGVVVIKLWATNESSKLKTVLLQRPSNLPLVCDGMTFVPDSWGSIPDPERLLFEHDSLCRKLESLGVLVVKHDVPEGSDLIDAVFVRDIAKVVASNLVLCKPKSPHRQPEAELFKRQWKWGVTTEAPHPIEGADVLLDEGWVFVSTGDRTTSWGASSFKHVYPGRRFVFTEKDGPSVPQHLLGGHRILRDKLFQRIDVAPMGWQHEIIDVEPNEEVTERLSLNWIALDHRSVLMPSGCPETKRLLTSNGVEVFTSPMEELSKLNGGFACGSLPLRRGV
jgi:N-dimethylarginine dimethylaminohydrolase